METPVKMSSPTQTPHVNVHVTSSTVKRQITAKAAELLRHAYISQLLSTAHSAKLQIPKTEKLIHPMISRKSKDPWSCRY